MVRLLILRGLDKHLANRSNIFAKLENDSATIAVTENSHGANAGDYVTFSGAASLGGNITAAVLNQEYVIDSITDGNVYRFTATATANSSDTGNGGTVAL